MLGWTKFRPAGRFPNTLANRADLARNLDCLPLSDRREIFTFICGGCMSEWHE